MPQLRRADLPDVPQLVALINAAYAGEPGTKAWTSEADIVQGPRITTSEVEELIASVGAILVAEEEGRIVGSVHVEPRDERGYIGLLSVAPDAQGARTGSFLMSAAEDHVRRALGRARAMVWVVSARDELQEWYGRLGYRRTKETHPFPESAAIVPGLSFVVMEKDLSA